MKIVLVLFLLMEVQEAPQPKEYRSMAARVTITLDDKVRDKIKSESAWKDPMDWLDDRESWVNLLKDLDHQLGIVSQNGLPIDVTVSAEEGSRVSVKGAAQARSGKLEINLPALIHAAAQFKEKPVHVLKLALAHELTHCFQQAPDGGDVRKTWPRWLTEGMACLAADDTMQDRHIKASLRSVGDLNEVSEEEAPYRGALFFKYALDRLKRDKLKEFIRAMLKQGDKIKTAEDAGAILGELMNHPWEHIREWEQRWSERYLEKIK